MNAIRSINTKIMRKNKNKIKLTAGGDYKNEKKIWIQYKLKDKLNQRPKIIGVKKIK